MTILLFQVSELSTYTEVSRQLKIVMDIPRIWKIFLMCEPTLCDRQAPVCSKKINYEAGKIIWVELWQL